MQVIHPAAAIGGSAEVVGPRRTGDAGGSPVARGPDAAGQAFTKFIDDT